jgi:DNA-binding IclR family transcriptional regulator
LDLLASRPQRRLSLTEIVRETGVNAASCLAILGELTQRGYLCRHAARKTYWLGPALIAAGEAAMAAHPTLERARRAAECLRNDLGLPVLLSMRAGEEIVGVFSLPDEDGRTAGLCPGERVPLVPPVGASFIAWGTPEEAESWIALRAETDADHVARWLRETLARTRERGFHVTLRRQETEDIASIVARAASGDRKSDLHRLIAASVEGLDIAAIQPDMLDADTKHDILLIASPIIESDTSAIYNLCLGGFKEPLTGTAIANLGRRLTISCVEAMNG